MRYYLLAYNPVWLKVNLKLESHPEVLSLLFTNMLKMVKTLYWSVLLFGLFSLALFYSLLLWRCISTKELKCFIPELLQADPVYVFVACR